MKKILYLLLLLPALVHAQSIHIITSSDTICKGSPATFNAADTGVAKPHFEWQVNNMNKGTDTSVFITDSLSNGDTVICRLTNSMGDTVFATSNFVIISVQKMPVVGPIFGIDTFVCVGATIILSDSTTSGVWGSSNDHATVSNGIITGIWAGYTFEFHTPSGTDTIFYYSSNFCGSDTASKVITIYPLPDASFNLSSSFCIGQQESLVDGNGYFENLYSTTGNVGIAIWNYIYGAKAGTDYLYNIVINVCGADTFGQSMFVFPNPSITTFASPVSELCSGDTAALISSYSGSPGWSVVNNNATITNSGVFKAVGPGLATIILSVSNNCGITSKTTTVNVLPPWPISGFDSLCVDGKIDFNDSTTGGTWSTANTNIATIDQRGIISGIAEGSVLISYEMGSCTVSKQIITIPFLSPAIRGVDSLCIGSSTMVFTDSIAGGLWISSDTNISVIESNTGTVYAKSAGIDTIIYTLSNGCTAAIPIIVKQFALITGPTNVCVNSETTLSADGSGKWSTANTSIASVDMVSGKVTGISVGYAGISYTLNTGCFDTTAITVTSCGDNPVIFPNPSRYEVIIQADTNLYLSYSLANSIGQTIYHQPIKEIFTKVNTQSLPTGIYFITLYGYNGKYDLKFLKEE